MTKRKHEEINASSEENETLDQEISDDDFLMEREPKKVKQTPLFDLVKATNNYDRDHYKCVETVNFDTCMLFSDQNKARTEEIREVIFWGSPCFLIIRTVTDRFFHVNEDVANTQGEVDCSNIKDKSSILKLVATGTDAYLLTKKNIYEYNRNIHSFEPLFSINNDDDEEFFDMSASFIDNLLILTRNNRIISSGWNKYGMLGNETTKSSYRSLVYPKTSHTDPVNIIVSGSCFSLYCSGDSLFACGELDNIGKSGCITKFEKQNHFKFQVSDIEKIISKSLFTCFWTKQNELHIYGKGFYTKIDLTQNIYAVSVLYANLSFSYKVGNEITQTRREHVSNGEFSKEVVIAKYDYKWFNSIRSSANTLLLFFSKTHEADLFKKVVTNFFDIIIDSS